MTAWIIVLAVLAWLFLGGDGNAAPTGDTAAPPATDGPPGTPQVAINEAQPVQRGPLGPPPPAGAGAVGLLGPPKGLGFSARRVRGALEGN
jgi:hypothetical protein